ncbi:DUF896 domain-containing protein [uncultured Eubacterium sp.]|uniref:DUF896 domain-containing protein n=1 Tax=uncultured Eubacterium sp. TaxID=165185 RepID=UPI002670D4B2|nr:DUF896 domain-containing protein [uncultured Eubacterium sp.]
MDEKKIARINELYKKSKTIGLTEDEKEEQNRLRTEYRMSIINNLSGSLNHMSIQYPDGTVKKVESNKEKH